ncbi:MAG: lysophospholipid acyltransferase family protein [Gammaproteobacteria bacterium]|nr:lysophospholipid acyltransferase family protein [Gammaproteobacteria bacterium]MBU1414423.1 lysophospholipid acyltransferase family protein [Gammaproteobacteria bacterium]
MLFLFRLLSRLPLPVLHNLGAALGWLVWLLSPAYRRHMRENIALAGMGHARNAAIAEAGKGIAEMPKLWMASMDEVVGLVRKVSGWEHFEAAWSRGEGVLLLAPHLGCFEMVAQYMAMRAPITALYRPPKKTWLRSTVEAGRRRPNLMLVPTDLSGVRALLKALKRRETVGIPPDQAPSAGDGRWLPFFGRPAYTMTLAARLSEAGPVTGILGFAERLHYGAGYHIHFFPLPEPLTGDTAARAAAINRCVEWLIRQCPEQYLWGYNRYKTPSGAPDPE